MGEELAYSIHLGSDKNRSKVAKKVAKNNNSSTTSFSNNAVQNAQQLSKVNKHNLRDYDHKTDEIEIVYGTNSLYKDVQDLYLQEFQEAQIEYDNKQIRADRKIGDYFTHISNDSKHDLACELIIELGDMEFWNNKTMEYKKQMTEVYKDQIYKLMKIVPAFKVANAVVHYDETSPHMHLVGVPVKDGYKNGMKKQVAKSQIFTKTSLKEIQDKMRKSCIEKFNEIYEQKATLKQKQKGRNRDINVNQMDGYSELKREQEKNTKRLKEANSKSDELDIKTQEIKEILNNLKSPLLDKNNKIISNENIDKFLNYTEEVKDTTKSIKGVNDLNITIDKVEKNYKNLESERDRLYYSNTEKDKMIAELKEEIKFKDNKINKLETALNKVKTELSKFKDFWRRLIRRFQTKVFDERFDNIPEDKRSYTLVAEDLERSGIFDDNDSNIVKNPRRKILTNDELAEIQAKKGKKKNDYNLDYRSEIVMNNELPKTKIDERTGIEYHLEGDYYIPNLTIPKQEKIILNKYGRMRLNYLKEHKKAEYLTMLMDGTLNSHLKEIQETATERVEQIIKQLKAKSNLTEDMKNTDMLYWVGMMNNFKNQAEEIIFNELINV